MCTTPTVPPESDDPASSTAEFSPPPVPSRQVLVPSLASGSTASPAEGSAYSFALAVSSDSCSLLPLRPCDPLFPESPDLFSPWSADSEGLLTTPSNFQISPVFSSGDSFYARSFFSDEDDRPSLLPAASEQSDSLADQSLETHASSHSSILSWFRNYSFCVASSSLSNKRCGVAILVKDTYNCMQVRKDDEGLFLQVEIDIDGNKLRFVSLYVPNKNLARNSFFASLHDFIDLALPTFICGDFNAVLNPDLDRRHHPSYAGPSQGATSRESVAALQSLLSPTHTFSVWRTRHSTDQVFSWDHASGKFSSRIDMIWVPLLFEQSISDCQYHTPFFSDHRYMLLTFHLDDVFARGLGVWKFNVSLLDSLEYCALVRSFWKTQENSSSFSSPLHLWDQGKFFLREITCCFARARAAEQSRTKLDLQRQLKHLQHLFDAGDSSFQLCAVQEELCAIHLREAKASQVCARCRWPKKAKHHLPSF